LGRLLKLKSFRIIALFIELNQKVKEINTGKEFPGFHGIRSKNGFG
jgi:hypothetical protein